MTFSAKHTQNPALQMEAGTCHVSPITRRPDPGRTLVLWVPHEMRRQDDACGVTHAEAARELAGCAWALVHGDLAVKENHTFAYAPPYLLPSFLPRAELRLGPPHPTAMLSVEPASSVPAGLREKARVPTIACQAPGSPAFRPCSPPHWPPGRLLQQREWLPQVFALAVSSAWSTLTPGSTWSCLRFPGCGFPGSPTLPPGPQPHLKHVACMPI